MANASLAKTAVRAYVGEVMTRKDDELAQTVIRRLEADTDGCVSAALARLKPAHAGLIIFYLIQSADCAKSSGDIVNKTKELADDYRHAAKRARELFEFCRGKTSMHLWSVLPQLVAELDRQAQFYDEQPRKLQISRKSEDATAEQLLALRHFSRRLRDEFQISRFSAKHKEAIRWLIEAALNCTVPEARVAEAIRPQRVGHSRAHRTGQCPN
jgi:hypothetical protein